MKAVRLRAFVVLLCMACATAFGHWMRPTVHLADSERKVELESIFPKSFGNWQIDTNIPASIVSPDVQAMLKELYNQTLSRTYINNRTGQRIMLSVAYGGDQSDASRAHRPDVCYPAQGFDVLSSGRTVLSLPEGTLPVERMVAKLGPRVEPITFWFAVGDYVAVSGQDQKLAQLRYGLRGLIPDGMLVRVSSIDNDEGVAYALQADFVRQMQEAFDPSWVPRVFGAASMVVKK
ncbi:MAG TPA: EpsI family protein [Burkholderiaceae bacterium]|jgi:EpsI family protein